MGWVELSMWLVCFGPKFLGNRLNKFADCSPLSNRRRSFTTEVGMVQEACINIKKPYETLRLHLLPRLSSCLPSRDFIAEFLCLFYLTVAVVRRDGGILISITEVIVHHVFWSSIDT